MKSVAGGLILALVLFGAAFVAWSEARLTRQMAVATERLATVQYDAPITETSVLERVPLPISTVGDGVGRHHALIDYWQARYRELVGRLPSAAGNNAAAATDPAILLLAANASFRSAQADTSDRRATVERLDRVIQAYADVLRVSPDTLDASYNYEYVAKLRDTMARTRPPRRGTEKPAAPTDVSPDLPTGPTVHGRPGAPPPDVPMEQFRTITPMRFEEREEMDPGQGPPPRRRG